MKKLVLLSMITFFMSGAAYAVEESIWDTSYNVMKFWRDGNSVTGEYMYDDGVLVGNMEGNIFKGWWRETGNAKECGPGNTWSGPVIFRFSDDWKSFTGDWGSCPQKIEDLNIDTPSRTWTGTLKEYTPPIANAQSVSTDEDSTKAVTLTGTDSDNDPLTYSVATQPSHGMLGGTAPNLTYTPAKDYNGTDSFTFKVSDGKTDSLPATVNITVNQVNDAPIGSYQTSPAISVKLSGSDVENDALTYTVLTQPAKGTLTGTAPNLIYIPNIGYTGTDSFTFKANDGKADSQTITVNLNVSGSGCSVVFDIGNDCKKGLEEAIDALQTITGVK